MYRGGVSTLVEPNGAGGCCRRFIGPRDGDAKLPARDRGHHSVPATEVLFTPRRVRLYDADHGGAAGALRRQRRAARIVHRSRTDSLYGTKGDLRRDNLPAGNIGHNSTTGIKVLIKARRVRLYDADHGGAAGALRRQRRAARIVHRSRTDSLYGTKGDLRRDNLPAGNIGHNSTTGIKVLIKARRVRLYDADHGGAAGALRRQRRAARIVHRSRTDSLYGTKGDLRRDNLPAGNIGHNSTTGIKVLIKARRVRLYDADHGGAAGALRRQRRAARIVHRSRTDSLYGTKGDLRRDNLPAGNIGHNSTTG